MFKNVIFYDNSDGFKWFWIIYKNILCAAKMKRFYNVLAAFLNLLINWCFYS